MNSIILKSKKNIIKFTQRKEKNMENVLKDGSIYQTNQKNLANGLDLLADIKDNSIVFISNYFGLSEETVFLRMLDLQVFVLDLLLFQKS